MNQLSLALPVEFSPRALRVAPETSDDDFRQLCGLVRQCQESSEFWARDLLIEARRRWGADAERELLLLGFAADTIEHARALAGLPRLSDALSLEHHLAIAKAEPERQLEWLNIAEESELSVAETKRSIRVGSVVREEEGTSSSASNFRFATIEGIAAQFRLWMRQCEEELERKSAGWTMEVKAKTLEMYRVLKRLHEGGAE